MTVIRRKDQSKTAFLLLQTVSQMLGGLVIKRYKDKIVLQSRPVKRSKKRKPSSLQTYRRYGMRSAVAFARSVNKDPVQKAAWKERAKGYSNVYQAAISWYMKNNYRDGIKNAAHKTH